MSLNDDVVSLRQLGHAHDVAVFGSGLGRVGRKLSPIDEIEHLGGLSRVEFMALI